MTIIDNKAIRNSIIQNEKLISIVVYSGVIISALSIILKLSGVGQLNWMGNNIPISSVWLILLALTIAHMYLAWLMVISVFTLLKKGTEKDSREVFETITTSGGLLIRNLYPRTEPVHQVSRSPLQGS